MVETIRLESGHTLTGIGGSNPSLSAISYKRYISEPILCFKSAVLNSPLFDSTDSSF